MAKDEKEWPVDIAKLKKGDRIGTEILVPFLGLAIDDRRYQIKLQSFVKDLEVALLILGREFVLRCDHGAAVILTDQEAAIYTRERFDSGWRVLRVSNRRARRVDKSRLKDDDRVRHDRAITVQAGLLVAMDRTYTKLTATPYERNTPFAVGEEPDA